MPLQDLYDALEEFVDEDEAEAALMCSGAIPQTCEEIAASAGVSAEYLQPLLDKGAIDGIIMTHHNEAGEWVYFRAALLPGLAENLFTLNPTKKSTIWLHNYSKNSVGAMIESAPLGRGGFRAIPVLLAVARSVRIREVEGSNPFRSTNVEKIR